MPTSYEEFKRHCSDSIAAMGSDPHLIESSRAWLNRANRARYSYNFESLGRPIIQYPQDMVAMQELIWHVRPDLIVETGIAHGGSLILSASMLALLDLCDAIVDQRSIDPRASPRLVVGVDIDIRAHNRAAIESHPMASRIRMIQGSSIAEDVVAQVRELAKGFKSVMVCLDSNHTHDHVLAELQAYAQLVTPGSYCVVFDTVVEDMPADLSADRPWGPGDNPKTAVREYLKSHPEFEIGREIQNKLLITVAPDGYLRRK